MKDNFSKQAEGYARYRPAYPTELFDFILSKPESKKVAWDCATGNGQTAKVLAKYFDKVYATDTSQKQLNNAEPGLTIYYSLQPAEQTNFPDNYFDLITVSQALHWLDFEKFNKEVKRVAKPGAWIAVWMYSLLEISPSIDEVIKNKFYKKTLAGCWDYERKFVDEHYATIPFPFEEIECPALYMQYKWTITQLEGFLNTWSAVQKFITVNNYNPVDELIEEIRSNWDNEKMEVRFPIYLRMGRVNK